MFKWVKDWAIGFGITFIVDRIKKFGTSIDWNKVRLDAEREIRAFVPWDWAEGQVISFVMALIGAVEATFSATSELDRIFKLFADERYSEGLIALRDLILGNWKPTTQMEKRVYGCLECFDPAAKDTVA